MDISTMYLPGLDAEFRTDVENFAEKETQGSGEDV